LAVALSVPIIVSVVATRRWLRTNDVSSRKRIFLGSVAITFIWFLLVFSYFLIIPPNLMLLFLHGSR
jgi:hypothetical protein